MVNRRNLLAALALVLLVWVAYCALPTKKRQIVRQFKAVASWMDKEGEESALAKAQRAQQAVKFFGPSCEVSAEAYEFRGTITPEDASRYTFAARSRCKSLSVKFYDVRSDFPGDDLATAAATVRISVVDEAGQLKEETHELDCDLRKTEGRWLFTRISLVQVLQK